MLFKAQNGGHASNLPPPWSSVSASSQHTGESLGASAQPSKVASNLEDVCIHVAGKRLEHISMVTALSETSGSTTAGERLSLKMLSSLWPMKSTSHASPSQLESLPIHSKTTHKVCLDCRLQQVASMEKVTAKNLADAGCTNVPFDGGGKESHYETFKSCIKHYEAYAEGEKGPDCKDAELGPRDLADLSAAEIIKPYLLWLHCTRATIRAFSTPEKTPPSRRRFVSHTPHFNDTTFLETYSLPTMAKLLPKSAEWKYAYCVDFRFFFAQFMIPKRLGGIFVFRDGGRWWELNTIPTGSSNAPMIAQCFSEAMTTLLRSFFCNSSGTCAIGTDAYVDNIRICANDLDVLRAALLKFYAIAKLYLIDINEEYSQVLQTDPTKYTFLGADYNHLLKQTSITEKIREKLIRAETLLTTEGADLQALTLRTLLSILGTLQYAAQLNFTTRCLFYDVMKFFRRRAAAGSLLDAPGEIWPCIVPSLVRWIKLELACKPRQWTVGIPPPEFQAVLYTDASSTGFGAVLYRPDGRISILAGRWDAQQALLHINIKEALAISTALDKIDFKGVTSLHLKVDNTSVLYTLEKRSSKSFALNAVILKITKHEHYSKLASLAYVVSHKNNADVLSRLQRNSLTFTTNNPLFGRLLHGTSHANTLEALPEE